MNFPDTLKNTFGITMVAAYVIGQMATFGYLTFFDEYEYTWWNWIIVLPINGFLATIWPIYWLILDPFWA